MFSGGDDRNILVWDLEAARLLEVLTGHENGVTSISFAYGDLYSGSFDHHVICWDLNDIEERIIEKQEMRDADIESRKYEVYWRVMESNKRGKKGGKGRKGGKKSKKKA